MYGFLLSRLLAWIVVYSKGGQARSGVGARGFDRLVNRVPRPGKRRLENPAVPSPRVACFRARHELH